MPRPRKRNSRRQNTKPGLDQILKVPIDSVRPSPENNLVYRPVNDDDPELIALSESIGRHGIREPLIVTEDNWIVSGHRRHAAARLAGIDTVPVRVAPIRREDDKDKFIEFLRECNRQRDKSFDEKLREELISVDPDLAFYSLAEFRQQASEIKVATREVTTRSRSQISRIKRPFADAIVKVVYELREYWPISVRTIHYNLLNDPPLRNSKRRNSRYQNRQKDYKDTDELSTRLRVFEEIPWDAICDETRPVTIWAVHDDCRTFLRQTLDGFGRNYWRNLQRSQPNHIEVFVEKNTVLGTVRPVCQKFCLPMTSGRGFTSKTPFYEMGRRFLATGKDKLIVVAVTDHDPSGECIADDCVRTLRDDLGIDGVEVVKAALTHEQVQSMNLHTDFKAKETDSRYRSFVERYGSDVYELESVPPPTLRELVEQSVDGLIDIDLFNAEVDTERSDAVYLEGMRRLVHSALKGELGGGRGQSC